MYSFFGCVIPKKTAVASWPMVLHLQQFPAGCAHPVGGSLVLVEIAAAWWLMSLVMKPSRMRGGCNHSRLFTSLCGVTGSVVRRVGYPGNEHWRLDRLQMISSSLWATSTFGAQKNMSDGDEW